MDQNQSEEVSIQLAKLSATLLELHRGLLDFERKNYESTNGDIGSSRNFLDLLMNHPAFNWLRKLSGLIVIIDEMIDPTAKNSTNQTPQELAKEIETLLTPDKQGNEFSQKYHTAIDSEPTIAIAHGQALIELKKIIAAEPA